MLGDLAIVWGHALSGKWPFHVLKMLSITDYFHGNLSGEFVRHTLLNIAILSEFNCIHVPSAFQLSHTNHFILCHM